jgi:hypothetical protein
MDTNLALLTHGHLLDFLGAEGLQLVDLVIADAQLPHRRVITLRRHPRNQYQ